LKAWLGSRIHVDRDRPASWTSSGISSSSLRRPPGPGQADVLGFELVAAVCAVMAYPMVAAQQVRSLPRQRGQPAPRSAADGHVNVLLLRGSANSTMKMQELQRRPNSRMSSGASWHKSSHCYRARFDVWFRS
jgi:hypothetical protein